VLVAGRRCPIIGRISMDQMTVKLPDDWGEAGDEVVLFGPAGDGVAGGSTVAWTSPEGPRIDAPETPRILCEEMARMLGTINYEIACDVAPRVMRTYRGVDATA
jgi:alanine racemase